MRLPLWAGRTTALVGILLVAVNLRTAVAAVSPIAAQIRVDIPIDGVGLGLIGALPPVAFAVSGVVGPELARRLGLERLLASAVGLLVIGHLLRGAAPTYGFLLAGSVVAFAGVGLSNVLLPPMVKKYFPDRIALLTTVYVMIMSISTAVPAALAAPIADTAGWRVSLGMWSVLAVVGLMPWLVVLARHRRDRARSGDSVVATPTIVRGLWRSRTAWLITSIFTLSSIHVYSSFAWLPQLLIDESGATPAQAGGLLAAYSLMGLPTALFVPLLVTRLRNVGVLVLVGIGCYIAGYIGLLIAPRTLTVAWVLLAGLGSLVFPVAMVLINLRTRTAEASVALSGFVHAAGYGVAAVGPVAVGALHESTSGWTVPLLVALASALACIVPGIMLSRPRFVDDELGAR